jgi:hypothetical protein
VRLELLTPIVVSEKLRRHIAASRIGGSKYGKEVAMRRLAANPGLPRSCNKNIAVVSRQMVNNQ